MFKLFALLFLITNGVTAEKPEMAVPNKRIFPTMEACTQFIDSDAGKEAKARIEVFLEFQRSKDVQLEAKFKCVPFDDDSI